MGCRFELLLAGAPGSFLRDAGEEAIALIEDAHACLTRFELGSVVWRLNQGRVERIDAELLSLFETCAELHEASAGVFDITRSGSMTIDTDRSMISLHHGTLDMGGVAKGFAVDLAIDSIRNAGVDHAFVHAGGSTVRAIGRRPDGGPWTVQIGVEKSLKPQRIDLTDRALSVSSDEQQGAHLIDPHTNTPAQRGVFGACVGSSATLCDAWSTVLAIRGERPARMPEELTSILPGAHDWSYEPNPLSVHQEAEPCQTLTDARS